MNIMHHHRTLMRLHKAIGHGLRQKHRQMGKGIRGGSGIHSFADMHKALGQVGRGKCGGGRKKLSFRY